MFHTFPSEKSLLFWGVHLWPLSFSLHHCNSTYCSQWDSQYMQVMTPLDSTPEMLLDLEKRQQVLKLCLKLHVILCNTACVADQHTIRSRNKWSRGLSIACPDLFSDSKPQWSATKPAIFLSVFHTSRGIRQPGFWCSDHKQGLDSFLNAGNLT